MTYEYDACAHADFDDDTEESDDKGQGQDEGHSITWRRRAKSLCDVTWEPICILKFLSQDCIYCEKKVIVTELKLQKVKIPKKTGSDNETEESSDDNGIEIIRSVQLKPGDGLIRAQNGLGTGAHETEHVCKPSSEDASHSIVIPVSVAAIKPSSNLPSWGLLPPVEEAEAEVDGEPEKEVLERSEKEIKLEVVFEVESEEEKQAEEKDAKEELVESEDDILDYSSEANDEILTRAYEVITENDDLLTALDKLEHHIVEGSDPLAEEAEQSKPKEQKENISDEQNGAKSELSKDVSVVKQRIELNNGNEKRNEFGFIVETKETKQSEMPEKDKCDSKLPKPGKTTSSAKCDETQIKSKPTKTNAVKQKEGNRLIRALNWVSKLPGRISADKQTKKHEHKHEKHEKPQEKQEKAEDEDDYGFFVKLNPKPLSERQSQVLKKLSQKDEEKTEKHDTNKVREETVPEKLQKEGETNIVTEVLSSFQPEVEDTHFQDNLRRFDNISLASDQASSGKDVQASESFNENNNDDEWEPGPRQTGSLPNLAGEFLSTSPTMERIREYMLQDESDDSSLDEFLLIPMPADPTDFEQTVGSASQPPQQKSKLNSNDVYDSEEDISASDDITSPNKCSNLASDADEKLPQAHFRMENISTDEHIPVSKKADATRLPRPTQTRPAGVIGHKNQTNVPVASSARGKRGSSSGVVPRAFRGAHQTPPYATPPRPIKGTLQVPTGRSWSRGVSRDLSRFGTRGRGIPTRGTGRGVTYTGLYAQKASGQFTAESWESGNKCSMKDKLNNTHGSAPSQHVATGKSNAVCPRLSQQQGSTPSGGSIGFYQEQQHYIASHKPTNINTVNSRLIHKAPFNRPSSYSSRGGNRGSNRGPALQKQGKSNIAISSSAGTKAGENPTPMLTDLDQSKPPQVKHPAGDPGVVQRVQAHITLLPGDTQTTDSAQTTHACSIHVANPTQLHQQAPLMAPEVSPPGNDSETFQDGGSNNWMDSGVQMDFTDES